MKNFIKNNIKTFMTILITTIIVGSVSVYAASQYFAKDITFSPTNENFKKENGEPINNVEEALNELYKMKGDKLFLYWYGKTYDDVTGGWKSSIPITKWGAGNNASLSQSQATIN